MYVRMYVKQNPDLETQNSIVILLYCGGSLSMMYHMSYFHEITVLRRYIVVYYVFMRVINFCRGKVLVSKHAYDSTKVCSESMECLLILVKSKLSSSVFHTC